MGRSLTLLLIGLGCLATGGQVHFVREFLALFAGNELSLAVVFGCWFFGIVLGAAAGGRLADRPRFALTGLMLTGTSMAIALFALVSLLRIWREVVAVPVGQMPSLGVLLLTGLAVVTPFGLLIGLAFPLACRAASAASAASEDPLTVGRVYVLESAGAVLGGVLVGVVLAGWLPPFASMALVCLPLLGGLTLTGWSSARLLAAGSAGLGVTLLVLLFSGLLAGWDQTSSGWRFDALQTGGDRLAWADTAYQHLDLAKRGGQYNLFSNGKLFTSFPDPYTASPRAHLVLTQHPRPEKVLLLGPSFAGFAPAALAHSIERLDVVEIDPDVASLVAPHLAAEDAEALADSRVRLHPTDGRRYLQKSDQRWDIIFADSPDPSTAGLNRFYTREFFDLVSAHLEDRGVFATRVSSGVNYLGFESANLVRGLQTTLESVFARVLVVPGQETFLFSSDDPEALLGDPDRLAARYRDRKVADPRFSHHQFSMLVQADLVADLQQQLETRGQALVNTDDRPVTYLQSVLVWSRMTGDPVVVPLRWLVSLPAWAWFLMALLATGVAALFLLPRRVDPALAAFRGAGLAIGLVGALGMALELVLCFAYQSLAGSLYQEIGLIVAAFMAGLVAGGAWIQRRLRRKPAGSLMLGVVLLALSAFTAALPWLQSSAWLAAIPMGLAQAWLLFLVLVAGAGTGVAFPLAGQIALRSGAPLGRAAGSLDARDHLGAALGALLSGMVLIPVLGRTLTCLLLAALCALAGLLNLMVSRRKGQ